MVFSVRCRTRSLYYESMIFSFKTCFGEGKEKSEEGEREKERERGIGRERGKEEDWKEKE